MKLYLSDYRERANNVYYKREAEITSTADLLEAVKRDHIFSQMAEGHRASDNYQQNDCIILDLDNSHSEDAEEWKTLDDVQDAFPDVKFYYVQSRNYMKEKVKEAKNGKKTFLAPREKYHLYFPLAATLQDKNASAKQLLQAAGLFPYLDLGAAEPAHFFFGVADPKGGYIDGDLTIDQYMDKLGAGLQDEITRNIAEYAVNVSNGTFTADDNTKKALTRLYSIIGATPPTMQTDTRADQSANASGTDPQQGELNWISTAEQQRSLHWLQDWAKANGETLGKQYQINTPTHPQALAICVTCPWEEEHSMTGAENETVVIIELSGKFDFLCRHSHGYMYSWKDYRKAVEGRAQKQDITPAGKEARETYQQNSAAAHIGEFRNVVVNSINTPAISTGFVELDRILDGGLYEGLYVLGAISSLGKTTLVLQIADNMAQQGRDVLIFSLEMARYELMAKSISRITYQDASNKADAKTTRGILAGGRYKEYNATEKELIRNAVEQYREYAQHIYIHEGIGDIGIEQLKEAVNRHIEMTGNRPIVIIDYLQILAPYDMRASDKQNTDKAVLELKRLSRDKKIPVIGISSFNRESYKDSSGNKGRVTQADFKESGAIEYSADVLIGLEFIGAGNKDYSEKEEKKKDPREIRLVILKNRNGRAWETDTFRYYPLFNYFEETESNTGAEDIGANIFSGMKAK